MPAMKLLLSVLFTSFLLSPLAASSQSTMLPNAYAHNDYWHKHPLFDALSNGFSYVEADVFLRKGELIVAHSMPLFGKRKTLEQLYLKPLLNYSSTETDSENFPITLMIDIKSAACTTYMALLQLLEKYRGMLSSYENGEFYQRRVTIVLTGHRPYELINAATNRLVFVDEDLRKTGKDYCQNLYPVASCKYSRISKWKGKGIMPASDRHQLKNYVAHAHANGRKVRLWASPENKAVWATLLQCNVDLISTNKLEKLKNFLTERQVLVAKAR